jgi:hypothetical protein
VIHNNAGISATKKTNKAKKSPLRYEHGVMQIEIATKPSEEKEEPTPTFHP